MKLKIVILAVLVVSLYACHHDSDSINNDSSDINIEVKHLETEYGCTDIEVNLTNDYMVIRNFSDYTQHVNSNCQANVDFSTYDLVIGKQQLSNGLASIDYELTKEHETSNLNLKITFTLNDTAEAPNVTYNALIPKLDEHQELNVEVVINQQ